MFSVIALTQKSQVPKEFIDCKAIPKDVFVPTQNPSFPKGVSKLVGGF